MGHEKFPPLQQPLFKNTLQRQEIALKMTHYKRKLYQVKRSKSNFINDTINPSLTYRELFEQNPKKNKLIQNKYLQIERQNKLLFDKISKMRNKRKKKSISSLQRMKSLNITMRKKQVEEIQIANAKIFQRIKNQKAFISFKQTDKEYKHARKFSQKLSKIQKYKLENWY